MTKLNLYCRFPGYEERFCVRVAVKRPVKVMMMKWGSDTCDNVSFETVMYYLVEVRTPYGEPIRNCYKLDTSNLPDYVEVIDNTQQFLMELDNILW